MFFDHDENLGLVMPIVCGYAEDCTMSYNTSNGWITVPYYDSQPVPIWSGSTPPAATTTPPVNTTLPPALQPPVTVPPDPNAVQIGGIQFDRTTLLVIGAAAVGLVLISK
jgi:hypothetical protein